LRRDVLIMASFTCERQNCKEEVYCKVAYLGKYLCLKHTNELGDFDEKGRLEDRRIKR
jgi:hypothetical protein